MLSEDHDTSTGISRRGAEPLTEVEAAGRLGLKVATLRAWRHQGRGPAFVRLGRAIRYLGSDIDEFLTSNRHRPTADGGR
jgi:predicted DNA-binding transcriptional regulator AlpA